MTRTMKAMVMNKKAVPHFGIQVDHVGKNDYRVVLVGIGEHSQHEQFGLAISKAQWLGLLDERDLIYEIAKVQRANSA